MAANVLCKSFSGLSVVTSTLPTPDSRDYCNGAPFVSCGKSSVWGQQLTSTADAKKRSNVQQSWVVKAVATETIAPSKLDWKAKRKAILKNKVKSVNAKEALKLQGEGYTILDVRPIGEFVEAFAIGSKNAPVYRLIKEWTPWDILRRAGFAVFGVFNGTEENPEFLSEVEALGLSKDSNVIVACSFGGTLKPAQQFPEGKESRSLIAIYILTEAGYTNLVHLDGGLSTWFKQDLPAEYKDD